jgi:hypothetical protein
MVPVFSVVVVRGVVALGEKLQPGSMQVLSLDPLPLWRLLCALASLSFMGHGSVNLGASLLVRVGIFWFKLFCNLACRGPTG